MGGVELLLGSARANTGKLPSGELSFAGRKKGDKQRIIIEEYFLGREHVDWSICCSFQIPYLYGY